MGDDVVELSRQPRALLECRKTCALATLVLELDGQSLELLGTPAQRLDAEPGPPRQEHEDVEAEVLAHARIAGLEVRPVLDQKDARRRGHR